MQKSKNPKVSVIIPFKDYNEIVKKCIDECLKLDYDNYEIVLLPDSDESVFKFDKNFPKINTISTGVVYPSEKRNMAVKLSSAEICAFIDSDAFPISKDWIKNAVKFFDDNVVGAVGGPNIVPDDAEMLEKASADVIYSRLCAGGNYPVREYKIKGSYEYREIASSNLFIRKDLFEKIGGFDPYQLTSEDSKLCFQISKLGKKVIFTHNVAVYHRRRRLFWPHTARVFIEGRNKAFVFKEIFDLGKLFYFLPSLFVLGVVFGFIFSIFFIQVRLAYLSIVAVYFIIALLEGLKHRPFKRSIAVSIGIILTHLSYGTGFIKGFFTDKYKLKKQKQLRFLKQKK